MAKTYTVVRGDNLSRIAARFGTDLKTILSLNPQFRANPNLIYAGNVVNLPGDEAPITPPAAPATPPTETITDKTAANNFGLGTPTDQDEINTLRKKLYETSQAEPDINTIRADFLAAQDQQIKAIGSMYDSLVAQKKIEGTGRLGEQRAISARSGLIGSTFGETQKTKVEQTNADIVASVEAERAAKISAILAGVEDKVSARIAEARAAKEKGAEEWLTYLEGQAERKKSDATDTINALLNQDIALEDITDEEKQRLAGALGLSITDFENKYKGEIAKAKAAAEAAAAKEDRLLTMAEAEKFGVPFGSHLSDVVGQMVPSTKKTTSGGGTGTKKTTTPKADETTPTSDLEQRFQELTQGGEGATSTSKKTFVSATTGDQIDVPTNWNSTGKTAADREKAAAAFLAALRDSGDLDDPIYNYVVAQLSTVFNRGSVKSRINNLMGQV